MIIFVDSKDARPYNRRFDKMRADVLEISINPLMGFGFGRTTIKGHLNVILNMPLNNITAWQTEC